jgi:hypothetical protein
VYAISRLRLQRSSQTFVQLATGRWRKRGGAERPGTSSAYVGRFTASRRSGTVECLGSNQLAFPIRFEARFQIIEPIIDQFNDMGAAAVAKQFGQRYFQDGELVLLNGNPLSNTAASERSTAARRCRL